MLGIENRTSEHARVQHCCMNQANDYISNVGWKIDQFQNWAYNTQHVETRRKRVAKRTQHVAPNFVANVEMLQPFGRPGDLIETLPSD